MKNFYLLDKKSIKKIENEYKQTYIGGSLTKKFKIIAMLDLLVCLVVGLLFTYHLYMVGLCFLIIYFMELIVLALYINKSFKEFINKY